MNIVDQIKHKIENKDRTDIVYIHPTLSNDRIAEYISAFSNTHDGFLVFGIKDDGVNLLQKKSAFNISNKETDIRKLLDFHVDVSFGEIQINENNKLEYIYVRQNEKQVCFNGKDYYIKKTERGLECIDGRDLINSFLFVAANLHEKMALKKYFKIHGENYILGKTYYYGRFGAYNATYIHIDEQGVTNPAATPIIGELIKKVKPVAVVMVGIAFGSNENTQKIGDVLISKRILPYDSQKFLETITQYKETPKDVGFQLLNAFNDYENWEYTLDGLSQKSSVWIGSILTGSRLINNYDYREKLLKDFKAFEPIGGEMEAYGIYSMCRLHGVAEWIIIKGICDWGYKKEDPNKEVHQQLAANAAADFCYHVFNRNGVFDDLQKAKEL